MSLQRNRAGASAIEIVLVIVIIILVAAVLFPMFARQREGTPKPRCQSNMKECALAIQLYWGDYDSTLPSSAVVSHSKTWNRRGFLRFATKVGEITNNTKGGQTWVQLLYPKMRNRGIWFCDGDPVDQTSRQARASYWWKAAVDKAWYGLGCKKPCRRESDFPYNADQVILYEHQPFHFGGEGGLVNGAQINVAYLDTHVQTRTIRNATSGNPINCAANSDGEPMYFNLDNTKPKDKGNPPANGIPAKYVDPGRYSDMLP